MGLLTEGKPLVWEDSQKYLEYVKEHGVLQFINLLKAQQSRRCDSFKWGDELEYLLAYTPASDTSICRLLLRSKEIQQQVRDKCNLLAKQGQMIGSDGVIVHPEYGAFQIESTPSEPYLDSSQGLLNVERNMLLRREILESCLHNDEKLLSIVCFPTLGVGFHIYPHCAPKGPFAMSDGISDALINPHPRFRTLTQNIRRRRGSKVDIRIPRYIDKNTKDIELKKEIKMDAMAYGMGMCCLQVTFQCRDIGEARHLYDQLAVLSPIMAALTAATPFYHGEISDNDMRWTVISQSVDDRTADELSDGGISKSRYDTVSCFLSLCDWHHIDEYNDVSLELDEQSYDALLKAGVDEVLARHIAHLFVRDPLVIYEELTDAVDDHQSTHHWETIQSTNWQSVRFKPPPSMCSEIGWRVEFRTMELSLTEFENTAYSITIALISRAILFFQLNFYIPISKVDENMKRAHRNNAALNERFFWRACQSPHNSLVMKEMTLAEILIGPSTCVRGSSQCRGLLDIVDDYLTAIHTPKETRDVLDEYLNFVKCKANGKLVTTAQWLRKLVNDSPLYRKDSKISEELCRYIVDVCDEVTHGVRKVPELLGDNIDIARRSAQILAQPPQKLSSTKLVSRL